MSRLIGFRHHQISNLDRSNHFWTTRRIRNQPPRTAVPAMKATRRGLRGAVAGDAGDAGHPDRQTSRHRMPASNNRINRMAGHNNPSGNAARIRASPASKGSAARTRSSKPGSVARDSNPGNEVRDSPANTGRISDRAATQATSHHSSAHHDARMASNRPTIAIVVHRDPTHRSPAPRRR